MSDFRHIYDSQNARYDRLVSHEDYEGNLEGILAPLIANAECIVEFGAGTGRITEILQQAGACVHAFDASEHMLDLARQKKHDGGWNTVSLRQAVHSSLPLPDRVADIAIAGWTFCHIITFHKPNWEMEMQSALAEMERVTKPGGRRIIVETMGTGVIEPGASSTEMAELFAMLEGAGFSQEVISTDYEFDSEEQMHEAMDFFFPGDLEIRRSRDCIVVPEYTAVFSKPPR
jgi:ubiquinone/menaquinone biosynthesis C-methylase UbiE